MELSIERIHRRCSVEVLRGGGGEEPSPTYVGWFANRLGSELSVTVRELDEREDRAG